MSRQVLSALWLALAATASAADLSDAERQGRQLAADLLGQRPATNAVQTGVIRIRPKTGPRQTIPFRCDIVAGGETWRTIYIATNAPDRTVRFEVAHFPNGTTTYLLTCATNGATRLVTQVLTDNEAATPFAGADFWLCDLGLEFLRWPEQRVVAHERRKTRNCAVLESVNPHPEPGAYRRVRVWVDQDSGGLVFAEAYDAQDKLLKEFDPKSLKKINGQWELHEMRIRNVQTDSQTVIEFNLGPESGTDRGG